MSPFRRNVRPDETLTPRELEVIELISSGATNRAICGELDITLETAKRHLANIFNKTGVGSRLELAVWRFQRLARRVEDVYEGGLSMTMQCPMCHQRVTAVLSIDGATAKLRPHAYGTSQLACSGSRCCVMAPAPARKSKVQA